MSGLQYHDARSWYAQFERACTAEGKSQCTNHFTFEIHANTCQLNVTDEYEDLMPFRNDDRISEEGFAAETVIHKDFVLDVMEANFMVRTSPFGMRANRWPGVSDSSGDLTKASAARHGIKFHTTYAIPMSVSVMKMAAWIASY